MIRILAAHDRPEVLRLVERSLGDRYECELATSVAAARERLDGPAFQLAMCDLQMQGGTGQILFEELRRHHPEAAVVVIAAADSSESAERAFRLGAHGYLTKPLWPAKLHIAAANALRQRRLEIAEHVRHRALLGSEEERQEALRNELIEAQRDAIAELRAACLEVIERLVTAIETRDPLVSDHGDCTATIAALLGRKLGLADERMQLLRAAAPMRDIGTIATPGGVLRKRGPLTPSEKRRMESHTTAGHRFLTGSRSELLELAAAIALTHHEWFDGSGYPRGLRGTQIPIESRLVAVADSFDALLSERPHRPSLTVTETMELIAAERGTHFDPDVVDALLESVEEAAALRP